MEGIYVFDLYGNVVESPEGTKGLCKTYLQFMSEEKFPRFNKLFGTSLNDYDTLNDRTSDHIYVIFTIIDGVRTEQIRFDNYGDIVSFFNYTFINSTTNNKSVFKLDSNVYLKDILHSIRFDELIGYNIIVNKLSKYDINVRKKLIII